MTVKTINTNFSEKWHSALFEGNVRISVCGNCWIDGVNITGQSLAKAFFELFSSAHDASSYSDAIPSTGNFCIVLESPYLCFAVTDRIRSIPLFYANTPKKIFISDDARWIKSSVNEKTPDPQSIKEFRYAGFVTGQNTLYSKVKQLQAGQWFTASTDLNSKIICHNYYKYIGSDPFPPNKEMLSSNLDKVFCNAFTRMVKVANGRTIVVPLSAGLDSRLVVTMLKRLDYENIIAFSYGKENNFEALKSREIANQIGCKWLFVPYTKKLWKNVHRSERFKDYINFASGLSMVPHIQDWIAVKHFKDNKMIPPDSIFAPGHTGDFIAGGHIPSYYLTTKCVSRQDVVNDIRNKHYRLWNLKKAKGNIDEILTAFIAKQLIGLNFENQTDAANAFEYFDWQERQPKHVVNSVRIYDYWEYDWLLPLWDTEVMDFWQKVPLEYKIEKRLYKEYLHEKDFSGVFSSIMNDTGTLQKIGIKKFGIVKKISKEYHKTREKHLIPLRKQYLDYYLDPFQWYGMYSYFQVAFKYGLHQNIYSLLSDSYLSELNKKNNI